MCDIAIRLMFQFEGSRRETAYLVGLASLINAVPKAVYVTQMPSVSRHFTLDYHISAVLLTVLPSSCPSYYAVWTLLTHRFVHTLLTHCQTILILHLRIRTPSRCMRRPSCLPCLKTARTPRCRILCVVPVLILSTRDAHWPKGVRAAALKYLALLPGAVRYDLLHPYKASVLKELAKTLDDPKRAVRKEAVNARYVMNTLSSAAYC
jgi:DNA repair/transcription protein MET18/MMS19